LCLDAADKKSYPGTGTLWTDRSGNGNNGTLTNGPTFSSANGGSIVFDGGNDYVSIPSGASSINSSNISVGCWVFQNNIHTSAVFVEIKSLVQVGNNEIGSTSCFYLHLRSSEVSFRYQNGSGVAAISPTINQEANIWHYYTGVFNDSSISLYRDGILVGSSQYFFSFSSLTNTNIDIGKTGALSNYFNGRIAQTHIYNRALTLQEIKQNFNATRGRYGI
jgi:hypothetical protein